MSVSIDDENVETSGTIADKLQYLIDTKSKIKDSINYDFDVVTNDTTFRDYATKIREVEEMYKGYFAKKVVSATNSVSLDNALPFRPKLMIKGKSKQETTRGNQLIDFNNPTENTPYTTSTFAGDVLTVSNTEGTYQCVRWDILNLAKKNPGKILYFSFENYDISNTNTSRINIKQRINDNTLFLGLVNSNATQLSVTIPTEIDNLTEYTLQILSNNSGTDKAATLKITKPMLQFGIDKLEYEQYTGGQASPNPDYPQEIENIDELEIVQNGKNLLNLIGSKAYTYSNGLPFDATNMITINSVDSNNINFTYSKNTFLIVLSPIYQLKPNTKYTISFVRNQLNNASDRFYIYNYDKDYSINFLQNSDANGNYSKTFTTSETGKIAFGFGANNTANGLTTDIKNIQLEEGTEATSYEQYKEKNYGINLQGNKICSNKDKTVRDEYNLETGKLKKKFKTVVLNGSESGWSKLSNSGDYIRMALNLNDIYSYTDSSRHIDKIMCSHFTPSTTNGYGIIYQYKNQILFYPNAEITTLDKWKAWLSENNIIVCYEIAESEEIQLDPVDIKMFDGTNNISVNANLDADFEIEYYKKPTVTDETVQDETNEVTEVNEVTSDE